MMRKRVSLHFIEEYWSMKGDGGNESIFGTSEPWVGEALPKGNSAVCPVSPSGLNYLIWNQYPLIKTIVKIQ